MSDPNDELMQQLSAADPVDRLTLPSPQSPLAQQMLEHAMTNNPFSDADPNAGAADETVHMLDLPEVPGVGRRSGGRRGWFIGAAAAVVLLIAGVLAIAPGNTSPALATVQGAAQATAGAETGRLSTVFSLDGNDGTDNEQIDGRLDAMFAGENVALSVQIDEAVGTSGLGELPVTDVRLVDGVFYANEGGQWYAVDAGGFIGQTVVDYIDPRSVLATVQSLVETEEVGNANIDGVETTQYRSVVDLADESLTESGWLPLDGVDLDAEGEVVVDLYVDGDGLLRRLDVAGDVREAGDGPGSATFTISTSFADIGADLSVEAPADAIEINPLDGFDTSELFGADD